MKIRESFMADVNTYILAAQKSLVQKNEAKNVIAEFIDVLQGELQKSFGEITVANEAEIVKRESGFQELRIFAGYDQSTTKFKVVVHRNKDGKSIAEYKLFSYEFSSSHGLPVSLRYDEGTIPCATLDDLAKSLSSVLEARALALVEWCMRGSK